MAGAIVGDQVDDNRRQRPRSQTQTASPPPQTQTAPPPPQSERRVRGHYETRVVVTESGETYEERVFVPDPER
jgi:hypothetical protein